MNHEKNDSIISCTICLDPISKDPKRRRRSSISLDCCDGYVHRSCVAVWNDTCLMAPRCPRCNSGLPDGRVRRMTAVLRKWMAETFYYYGKTNSFAVLGIQPKIYDEVSGFSGVQEISGEHWVLHLQLVGKSLTLEYPPLPRLRKVPTPSLQKLEEEVGFMGDDLKNTRVCFSLK